MNFDISCLWIVSLFLKSHTNSKVLASDFSGNPCPLSFGCTFTFKQLQLEVESTYPDLDGAPPDPYRL